MMDAIEAWRGFWSSAATISAILLGLLFVWAAINAGQMLSAARPQLRGLGCRAMSAYATVALLGLLVQMPILSPRRLGAVISLLGLICLLVSSWAIARAPKAAEGGVSAFSWTQIGPWLGYVIVLWAGTKLVRGVIHGIDWLGIAAIFLVVVASAVSLDLLRRLSS